MGFSLFRRGHGAFPLQFIDQVEDLGEPLHEPGAGTPEPAIALRHRLPLRPLALGDHLFEDYWQPVSATATRQDQNRRQIKEHALSRPDAPSAPSPLSESQDFFLFRGYDLTIPRGCENLSSEKRADLICAE